MSDRERASETLEMVEKAADYVRQAMADKRNGWSPKAKEAGELALQILLEHLRQQMREDEEDE